MYPLTHDVNRASAGAGRFVFTLVLALAVIIAQALRPAHTASPMPALQLNDSAHATLGQVSLSGSQGQLTLYGEVRPQRRSRAYAPGKVRIELLDQHGNSRQQLVADYRRHTRRANSAWFLVDLTLPDEPIASISVTHLSPFSGP